MDLSFSDEQVLLRDSIHKYLNAKYRRPNAHCREC